MKINKIQNKNIIQRINKIKFGYLKTIHKMDNPLSRLTKTKEKITKIRK